MKFYNFYPKSKHLNSVESPDFVLRSRLVNQKRINLVHERKIPQGTTGIYNGVFSLNRVINAAFKDFSLRII